MIDPYDPDWPDIEADPDVPAPSGYKPSRCGIPWNDLQYVYDTADAERPWFADGAIEGTPIVVLSGPEKRAKSWCAMQLAAASCIAAPWLGCWPVRRFGSPIYLDGEYGAHEFARRLARISRGMEQRPEVILPVVRHLDSNPLVFEPGNSAYRKVLLECQEDPPVLIIVDPLRNHLAGDENEAQHIIGAFRMIAALRDAASCPVLVIHHLNKTGYSSGSRAIQTRADLLIHGTDEDDPEYTVRGRTVRAVDSITAPFHIDVTHVHDEDDRRARSVVSRRSIAGVGDAGSQLAARIMPLLETGPKTVNWMRGKLNRNQNDILAALQRMEAAGGLAQVRLNWGGRTTMGWKLADRSDSSERSADD